MQSKTRKESFPLKKSSTFSNYKIVASDWKKKWKRVLQRNHTIFKKRELANVNRVKKELQMICCVNAS